MAIVKIKVDLKEERTFLISNEDATALIQLCYSLDGLEARIINEVE